ncbi:MAG TPA: ATP-binding protein [Anaeromyxobacteraceae bacterium]|nr:ATP-binding protein [Anaeromyxobacteraceae bacterium]
MTLRVKLVLAQAPLAAALLVLGAASVRVPDALDDRPALLLAILAAVALAGLVCAGWLTARLLRPLGALADAARRIGEGDLEMRAPAEGKDEIAAVGAEFNTMAERLRGYRSSSLGELILAQRAAQVAIDSLPDPVIVLDGNGAVLELNGAAEALFPRGAAPSLAALPGEVRAALERVAAHVLGGNGPWLPRGLDEAVQVDGADGPRRLLPRAAALRADVGGVVGATLVLQEVTRLVRFDELKNDLVSTVAHEFRTPLTSLRMAIHMCAGERAGPVTDKQADLLFTARQDCERLQTIVDDLLDLSRIQAGRLQLARGAVAPHALVAAALEAHRGAAAAAGIALDGRAHELLPDVDADRERVDLVLSNLLGNALKYTPAGGAVELGAAEDGDGVRFEVRDSGSGVAAEYHGAIFEKYFRVPGAAAGGVGLGLWLAREIVEAHGGRIGVESAPGQGSVFWFTLPRAAEARAAVP